ncbi:MAG: PAS domain S-box protein, partial [Betaproteobacteria bacterium]|nr:PAS domain S-box protein [Betaproteobacteria bacterium]
MNDRTGPVEPAPAAGQVGPSYAGLPRDAQSEYKAILANASIGIAFTRDRKFFLCNTRFAEMLGWAPEELIGQGGEVIYPSRESYETLGALAVPVLGAGRQLDIEWEIRRRDGSTFPCRLIARAINAANTRQGTIWIAEDLTERKRQADEMTRLLREQELVLDNASVGIAFARQRKLQRCNPRLAEMFGYEPDEMVGRDSAILFGSQAEYDAEADLMCARLVQGST